MSLNDWSLRLRRYDFGRLVDCLIMIKRKVSENQSSCMNWRFSKIWINYSKSMPWFCSILFWQGNVSPKIFDNRKFHQNYFHSRPAWRYLESLLTGIGVLSTCARASCEGGSTQRTRHQTALGIEGPRTRPLRGRGILRARGAKQSIGKFEHWARSESILWHSEMCRAKSSA